MLGGAKRWRYFRFFSVFRTSVLHSDGLSTQVLVGPDEGLKKDSSIHWDELQPVPEVLPNPLRRLPQDSRITKTS